MSTDSTAISSQRENRRFVGKRFGIASWKREGYWDEAEMIAGPSGVEMGDPMLDLNALVKPPSDLRL